MPKNNEANPQGAFEKIAEKATNTPESLWIRAVIQFTKMIAQQMDRQGINRAQLAERLKVSPSQITQVLRGDTNLKIETMAKLADALNCEFGIVIRPRKAFVGSQFSQVDSKIDAVATNINSTELVGAAGAPTPFSCTPCF